MAKIFETNFENNSFLSKNNNQIISNSGVLINTEKRTALRCKGTNSTIYKGNGASITKLSIIVWLNSKTYIMTAFPIIFNGHPNYLGVRFDNLFVSPFNPWIGLMTNGNNVVPHTDTSYLTYFGIKRMYSFCMTYDGKYFNSYVNGIPRIKNYNSTAGSLNIVFNQIEIGNWNNTMSTGNKEIIFPKIKVYNHILSKKEIDEDSKQFLNAKPQLHQIYY